MGAKRRTKFGDIIVQWSHTNHGNLLFWYNCEVNVSNIFSVDWQFGNTIQLYTITSHNIPCTPSRDENNAADWWNYPNSRHPHHIIGQLGEPNVPYIRDSSRRWLGPSLLPGVCGYPRILREVRLHGNRYWLVRHDLGTDLLLLYPSHNARRDRLAEDAVGDRRDRATDQRLRARVF